MKRILRMLKVISIIGFLISLSFSCKNKNEDKVTEIESVQSSVDISETEDEAVADNEIDEDFLSTPLPENKIKYIPFRYNDKYGLLDEQMNVKMKETFDLITVYDYSLVGQTSYLEDYDGHNLYNYENTLFDNSLKIVSKADQLVHVSEKYWVESFPLSSFLINLLTGEKKEINIKSISLNAYNMEKETYYAADDRYLDKALNEAPFTAKMSMVYPFRDNRALVYGYDDVYEPYFTVINEDGEKVVDGIWDASMYYSEGLLPVFLDSGIKNGSTTVSSGVIDESGVMKFKCNFFSNNSGGKIHPGIEYMFKDGVCVAKIYERDNVYLWKIIDKKGNFTKLPENFEPLKDNYPTFKEGYLALKSNDKENAKYIFINKNAEQVFGVTFDYADDFVNGYAVVKFNGEDAVLDTQGNVYLSKDLLKGNKEPFTNILAR